ncbi:MAG: sensor histidine kinase [Haliscomenobacteraceae bacterium CHB4]|nr:Adaptive-response sensory-kinase SasA [Saprospiraceae bacterium]MCE7923332.1 sensor histidine kinase [Haliscomenobacteraceae bacterium CHB4]
MPLLRKHHPFLWLIFSSLALLVVFQALWLQKVWREQRENFRQEADYIFQKTVMALQDTLVRRNLAESHLYPDSALPPVLPRQFVVPELPRDPESPPMKQWQFRKDAQSIISLKTRANVTHPDSMGFEQVQIIVTTSDSITPDEPHFGRLISKIPPPAGGRQRFVFKVAKDTIPTDSLRLAYREALAKASIPLDFRLLISETPEIPDDAYLRTEPAFSGVLTHRFYTAEFPSFEGYLFKKILPHLLFSLLLFGVTATAFGLIYKSLRQQQRLTALKNDFIGNITHELKTPITTVGVTLEALSDFDVLKKPEQAREYLDIAKLELERLTLLVDKVLRLSMFEEKQLHLQLEPLDLAELVRQVLTAMHLQAESVGATIHFKIEGDGPFRVNGDRLHLTSVVFNLLDNALKYRRKEAPAIKVMLCHNQNDTIKLTVQDNGIGIASEYLPKVFEKFFRVPVGDIHNIKGHGLGLNYVANVVRQHGGHIRVESEEGKGSRFVVELPGCG